MEKFKNIFCWFGKAVIWSWTKLIIIPFAFIKEWASVFAVLASFYLAYTTYQANERLIVQTEEANKQMIKHQQNLERHKWINNFREAVTEFLSVVTRYESTILTLHESGLSTF